MRNIKIFDTTLRDGEQSPGCSMTLEEKVEVAKQLEKLGVDVIEAGFAVASDGDFNAIQAISRAVESATIASLSRATKPDILRAYNAVKEAKKPRIHTFIATSDIHLEYKLKKTRDEVADITKEMVSYAKSLCDDVEFSCEDATRTDKDYLCRIIKVAIDAGANVINIPDTVGYTTPTEYSDIIRYVKENVEGIENIDITVHCHNDLGLGTANTLAAVAAGATQVECTVNGIGERAGNTALEEVVMALKTRSDFYDFKTDIVTTEIMSTSQLISYITGVKVQPNKAIVGDNAFAHESGIHQHGVLNNRETYEIMTPESIGLTSNKVVLGKHSGKHAFVDKLKKLGFDLTDEEVLLAFTEFKTLVDKKKEVFDADIIAIVHSEITPEVEIIKLKEFAINSSNNRTSTSVVALDFEDKIIESVEMGHGSVDASFNAIQRIIGLPIELLDYSVNSVSKGRDAQGEAFVKVIRNGEEYTGRGLSTDIVEASILAFVSVVNKILGDKEVYKEVKEYIADDKNNRFRKNF